MILNRKGQALIEFVLILPVLLMVLFAIIDMGNVFVKRINTENDCYDIVLLYNSGKSIKEINDMYSDLSVSFNIKGDYAVINVKRNVKLITPGAYRILDNPFEIYIERVIPYET